MGFRRVLHDFPTLCFSNFPTHTCYFQQSPLSDKSSIHIHVYLRWHSLTRHVSNPPSYGEDFWYKWVGSSLEPKVYDIIVGTFIWEFKQKEHFLLELFLWATHMWKTHHFKMINVWILSLINDQISAFQINLKFSNTLFSKIFKLFSIFKTKEYPPKIVLVPENLFYFL